MKKRLKHLSRINDLEWEDVFGERTTNDVVVYPKRDIMLVKALGRRRFTTKPYPGAKSTQV